MLQGFEGFGDVTNAETLSQLLRHFYRVCYLYLKSLHFVEFICCKMASILATFETKSFNKIEKFERTQKC